MAVDLAHFFALRKLGAKAHAREKSADARARRTNALSEIALWHQFKLHLSSAIERVEVMRIGLARERANHLAHFARSEQRRDACLAVARVVGDDGEVACALRDESVDERHRHARAAKAADHDRRTITHIGERLGNRWKNFVDQSAKVRARRE